MPPIYFGFYDEPFSKFAQILNNGHSSKNFLNSIKYIYSFYYLIHVPVEFEIPQTTQGERPFITGGPLEDDIYEAEGVHFHWGSRQFKGSEHEINGYKYDLEMHIVHRNVKYESIEIARDFEDGLTVLGILFKVVKVC